ncbi:MEKHLA domain-containing protein [Paenibacillus sp. NPDC058071]|uniref:MEKHLA domain-containing protein n=1 Tax=Paenibacillus sp. NPDC058071 TaxID=3346326 RepID=UPI0036D88216
MTETARTGTGASEAHSRLLADSFKRWTGQDLLALAGDYGTEGATCAASDAELAEKLNAAPFVLLSHGTETDPVLNFGNERALRLWEMSWTELTSTPSRLTAEPMERAERDRFFERVTADGYVDNYTGVRISKSGLRFYIVNATVWNLVDEQGNYCGQAAAFVDFRYL